MTNWISVEDGLPTFGIVVELKLTDGSNTKGVLSDDSYFGSEDGDYVECFSFIDSESNNVIPLYDVVSWGFI